MKAKHTTIAQPTHLRLGFKNDLIQRITFCMLSLLLVSGGVFGQAFLIDSPIELAGGYEFAAANFGRTLTDSVWTEEGVFVEDANPNPTEGCDELINGGDVAGKIALIDRGSCEFGQKCLNAENAGAVAAVVINTAPGAGVIVMGAGTLGGEVTIPCVMIPFEIGQLIRNAQLNNETVIISMGDLVAPPPPANDLLIANANVLIPQMGIVPASQVQAPGDFIFQPGATTINNGVNPAPNYTIDVTITHTPFGGTPSEVYNDSFSSDETLMPDDTTELVLFEIFDPVVAGLGEGVYEYSYEVSSDSTDNAEFNNITTGTFTLSQNLYSKATWDPTTGDPHITATIGAGPIEFLTLLEIPYGLGFKLDSVIFDVRLTPSLANINLISNVYEWNDANDDSNLDEGELDVVKGIGVWSFGEDETRDRVVLRLPFLDFDTFEETGVPIPEDDMKYVVGVRYEEAESVSLGFDSNIDYQRTAQWKEENGQLTDLDIGILDAVDYLGGIPVIETIQETRNQTDAKGIIFTSLETSTVDIEQANTFDFSILPNPVSNRLQINVTLQNTEDFIDMYIVDLQGRLIMHRRERGKLNEFQVGFDVSNLAAGEYKIIVRTANEIQGQSFIVAH